MSEIDWSKAPEGATHCDPVTGYWWGPSSLVSDGFSKWSDANGCWVEHANTHRPDIEIVERLIPRPTQWRGPEDGLPGMGDVCEYCPATSEDVWYRCIFIGTVGGEDFVLRSDNVVDRMKSGVRGRFRGLKSDKERAVEAAMRHYGEVGEWKLSPSDFCGDLYDAGLLRLPEGQS